MKVNSVKSQTSFRCNVGFDQNIPAFLVKQGRNIAYAQGQNDLTAVETGEYLNNEVQKELDRIGFVLSNIGTANDTFVFSLTPESTAYIQKPTKKGEKFEGADGVFFSQNHMARTGELLGVKFTYESLIHPSKQATFKVLDFVDKFLGLDK